MRGFGAPEKEIAKARAQWEAAYPAPEPIEVFPENADAFQVLIATAGQWEHPGAFGGRLALPLTEIHTCMQMLAIPVNPQSTMRVMAMVNAARTVLWKQHKASIEAQSKRR